MQEGERRALLASGSLSCGKPLGGRVPSAGEGVSCLFLDLGLPAVRKSQDSVSTVPVSGQKVLCLPEAVGNASYLVIPIPTSIFQERHKWYLHGDQKEKKRQRGCSTAVTVSVIYR